MNGVYSYTESSLPLEERHRLWVNDTASYGAGGLQALYAHEIGHFLGLHEAYLHDGTYTAGSISCNTSVVSVMDSHQDNGSGQLVACDTVTPTVRDTLAVEVLYRPLSPTITSSEALGSDLIVSFDEANYSESQYVIVIQRYDGSGWTTADQRWFYNTVAPVGHTLTWSYTKPANLPAMPEGDYRACIAAANSLYGSSLAACTTGHWLSDDPFYDRDGDGFSDVSEAGTPFCRNISNDDTADDSRVNDGCPAYGGLRELDGPFEFQCNDAVENDVGDDSRVNDGCPAYGTWSEADYKLGTNANSACPATATPNDEPVGAGHQTSTIQAP